LIQAVQGFLEIFILVKNLQRLADGQRFLCGFGFFFGNGSSLGFFHRFGIGRGHGIGGLGNAQHHTFCAIGAGQRIKHTGGFLGGLGLGWALLADRTVERIIFADVEQGCDGLGGQGGIISGASLKHLEEGVLGQSLHGIGIEDKLVALSLIGLIILVGADFVGIRGNANKIHHAPAAQGTHTLLEGMLLVAVGHDAQTSVVRPEALCLVLHGTGNGKQRTHAEIGPLDIIFFDKTEYQFALQVHNKSSTQYVKAANKPPCRFLLYIQMPFVYIFRCRNCIKIFPHRQVLLAKRVNKLRDLLQI